MNIGEHKIADLINNRLQRVDFDRVDMERFKVEMTKLLKSLEGQFYTREAEDRVRMTLEEIINKCSIRYVDKPKKEQPKAEVPDYAVDPLELLGEGDDGEDSSTESWWLRSPQNRLPDTAYWIPSPREGWASCMYPDTREDYNILGKWVLEG